MWTVYHDSYGLYEISSDLERIENHFQRRMASQGVDRMPIISLLPCRSHDWCTASSLLCLLLGLALICYTKADQGELSTIRLTADATLALFQHTCCPLDWQACLQQVPFAYKSCTCHSVTANAHL